MSPDSGQRISSQGANLSKIIMDVLEYSYGDDYAAAAVKAGFIDVSNLYTMEAGCTRREVLKIIDRLYEKMTASKAETRYLSGIDNLAITRSEAMVELYNMLSSIGEVD